MSIFCAHAGVPLPGGDVDLGGPGGDGDGKDKGVGAVLAAPSVTVTWGRQSAHRPDFFAVRGTIGEQMTRVSPLACYRANIYSYVLAAVS